jgi:hypothetical protein
VEEWRRKALPDGYSWSIVRRQLDVDGKFDRAWLGPISDRDARLKQLSMAEFIMNLGLDSMRQRNLFDNNGLPVERLFEDDGSGKMMVEVSLSPIRCNNMPEVLACMKLGAQMSNDAILALSNQESGHQDEEALTTEIVERIIKAVNLSEEQIVRLQEAIAKGLLEGSEEDEQELVEAHEADQASPVERLGFDELLEPDDPAVGEPMPEKRGVRYMRTEHGLEKVGAPRTIAGWRTSSGAANAEEQSEAGDDQE